MRQTELAAQCPNRQHQASKPERQGAASGAAPKTGRACSSLDSFLWEETRRSSTVPARRPGSTWPAHSTEPASGSTLSFAVVTSACSSASCARTRRRWRSLTPFVENNGGLSGLVRLGVILLAARHEARRGWAAPWERQQPGGRAAFLEAHGSKTHLQKHVHVLKRCAWLPLDGSCSIAHHTACGAACSAGIVQSSVAIQQRN